MAIKIYDVTLPAGEQVHISAQGRYIRIFESVGDIQLTVDGTKAGPIQQGIGVELLGGFKELALQSGTAQQIKLAVSSYRIDDNRLSFDSVVSTREENRSKEGNQFIAAVQQSGSSDFPMIVVKNENGSGKTVVVNSYAMNALGNIVQIYTGVGSPALARTTGAVSGVNKSVGGADASIAIERGGDLTTPEGAKMIGNYRTDANGLPTIERLSNAPIVMQENTYFLMLAATTTGQLDAVIHFSEE